MIEKIKKNILDNYTSYIILIISLLLCMFMLYNAKGYEKANTNAWVEFVKDCKCQCIDPQPNVTFDIKIPIYEELKGDENNEYDNRQ